MVRPYPAIILAAGASQRLGQPKSLVKIGTTTLVGLAQQKLIAAGCSPIVVVTRSELMFDVMKATMGATVVANATPENGRTGSLQCGLLSLAGDTGRLPRGVIVAPVDRPGWAVEHVRSLLESSSSATLSTGQRRGHPLFLDSKAVNSVLAAPADEPLRDIVQFSEHVVEAPHLGLNIDTPEDLRLLASIENQILNMS